MQNHAASTSLRRADADFYWRDLPTIAEQVFLTPLPSAFKYFPSQDYLDRQISYQGGSGRAAHLARWKAGAPTPELLEFMEKAKSGQCWPKLLHARSGMTGSTWSSPR